MTQRSFVPQRVIITGATGVLGAAVAEAFCREHHRVVLVGHAAERGTRAASAALQQTMYVGGADLTDRASAAAACAQACAALNGVDVLVNVAGGFSWEPLPGGSVSTWEHLFAVNLTTCANMCREVLGRMSDDGCIINVGSTAALHAAAGMGAYAASKSAVARLTESLAAELQARRIRVNAVLPAVIDTPKNRADLPTTDPSHWTSPQAIADVIVFLASAQARAINGALIPVTNAA